MSYIKFVENELYGYDFKPNNHFIDNNINYYIDSNSNRSEINLTNSFNIQNNIYVIGCSQAFGQGVEFNDSFTGLLHKKNYNISNYSVSGYGTIGSFQKLFHKNKDLKKNDLIVYLFWDDHLNRNLIDCLETDLPVCIPRPIINKTKSQEKFELKLNNNPSVVFEEISKLKEYSPVYYAFKYSIKKISKKINDLYIRILYSNKDKLLHFKEIISIFDKKINTEFEEGINLLILYLPNYLNKKDFKTMDPLLIDFFINNNIQYYDLHNFLSNLNNEEISIQNDGHISKLVHEKISEVIEDFIVNN